MRVASGAEGATASALLREAAAYRLFEAARWPDGPSSCPHCGVDGRCRLLVAPDGIARPTRTGRLSARRVWRCAACRRQFSVLTGTMFEGTKVPLNSWLDALRILSVPGSRVATVDLARSTGLSGDTARSVRRLVRTGLAYTSGRTP